MIELTITLVIRIAAIVYMTPIFILPGIAVGAIGSWFGQIYIKAQLSVKREMSNAKAPVMSHLGAAIAGLVSIRAFGAQNAVKLETSARINRYTRSARTFYNLNRSVSTTGYCLLLTYVIKDGSVFALTHWGLYFLLVWLHI